MPFIQFRVHPGVGCARFGNSAEAYHLASEFPYFMQEEFPSLRFKPKPRVHPRRFFTRPDETSATGSLAGFSVYDTRPTFQGAFKEAEGKIFPQATRFRVFAYVYKREDSPEPHRVFEVTTAHADITWTVTVGNKKTVRKVAVPDPSLPVTDTFEHIASDNLDTADTALVCRRLRTFPALPNLGYLFLERDDADPSKVNGRLHVIGNEGELVGRAAPTSLWSDDWYDSGADGSVRATIRPKAGAALRSAAGASSASDMKFLAYGTDDAPLPGNSASVEAMPGWVVVGPPDYVPEMGFFVSLWDMAFDRARRSLEEGRSMAQPGKHKLITSAAALEAHKKTDYLVHIHPNLCLFDDVRFVSGEAFGQPELAFAAARDRAHAKHPGGPLPAAQPGEGPRETAVRHGGAFVKARSNRAALADPKKLRGADHSKPITEWLKTALLVRLRKPGNLYDVIRKFHIKLPGAADSTPERGRYPRKLGRRHDYDTPPGPLSDKGKMFEFPHEQWHDGDMRRFHGLVDAGSLCGRDKAPPTAGPPGSAALSAAEKKALELLDDIYWPADFADMPMLRELAFTATQYDQFRAWAEGKSDTRNEKILNQIVSRRMRATFAGAGDADAHFTALLAASPKHAPGLIDMAHLGAMLGGSFLPGIEVGREGGIATNWSLFRGATVWFPSVRFKPSQVPAEHTVGTLTKDLAIPWSEDFQACNESYWPTSRPGVTTKDGVTHHKWIITQGRTIPHLGRTAADSVEWVKEYWKALGFIRRDATDTFLETEQSWH